MYVSLEKIMARLEEKLYQNANQGSTTLSIINKITGL
jgi:hypothetical protein